MGSAKKSKTHRAPITDKYMPEELEAMRQAFIYACHDNPDLSTTEAQRYDLADALVSVYEKHLTQVELVAAAVRKIGDEPLDAIPPRTILV